MSAFFNNLLGGLGAVRSSPLAGKLELPPDDDSPTGDKVTFVGYEKCELRIEGMTCGACVESIEGMLRQQDGIHSIKVALLAERGVVEYNPEKWDAEKIINEICDIGFDATLIPPTRSDTVILRVYGMTCSSCTSSVETQLSALPGINSVSVNLSASSCQVEFDRSLIGPREMVERIEELGFDAMLSDQDDATQIRSLTRTKEIQEWKHRFGWSVVFAVPVFFLSMVSMYIPPLHALLHTKIMQGIYLGDVLVLALTTPAQFWLGAKFYRNAWKSLKHGSATMDVLVMLGTSAAYFYSLFSLIAGMFNSDPDYHPFTFFDTSTMLIMFVSMGRYLENKAKGRTSAALTDLMALAPSMATIYTDAPACTQEKKIPTELVQMGDTVKLVPGDKVPADGTVVRGTSTIDESAVTGEPHPVLKQPGDAVIGGTVNGLGTFDMLVTRAGKDTALAQIVRLVEEAQTSKAPIQAFADKVAGYFVPTVISLALLTFFGWMIISNMCSEESLPNMFKKHGASKLAVCLQLCISVVVVACPCALGLSTPTAIMVGTGVGAKNGILIKGGRALEASRGIKGVVFDKTGTVTEGKMSVVEWKWAPSEYAEVNEEFSLNPRAALSTKVTENLTRADVVAMVAATEARSEHPLAKAVAVYGKDVLSSTTLSPSEVTLDAFESVTGSGVKATVLLANSTSKARTVLRVGNARFAGQSNDPHLPGHLAKFNEDSENQGRTTIFVSLAVSATSSPRIVLAISLSDVPKPSSKYAVRALRKMGLQVYMMTGDARGTALAVAREVGIHEQDVWAAMSPKGKASVVTELMEKHGGGIAMVGDGINDSPALVAASLGIALSSGTSIAIEAASIVLMRSSLLDLVAALHLSRAIFRTIRRNLLWACVYNVMGIPLAMGFLLPLGVHLHPMVAGGAMAMSSVSVVTSSLSLKWWVRPAESLMPGEVVAHAAGLGVVVTAVREWVRDGWGAVRDLVRGRRGKEGYSQLPLEMNEV